jgi:hypothetical protein
VVGRAVKSPEAAGPRPESDARHGTLPLVIALSLATGLGLWADAGFAAPKKAKKRAAVDVAAAEPYVMIFSPSSSGERPQAVVETRSADVPDAPLLLLTMGSGPTGDGGQDVEPEEVGVAEKAVILDKAEVDAPAGTAADDESATTDGEQGPKGGKAPKKAKKTKKKKKAAPEEP